MTDQRLYVARDTAAAWPGVGPSIFRGLAADIGLTTGSDERNLACETASRLHRPR
jgi:hypothetical protein